MNAGDFDVGIGKLLAEGFGEAPYRELRRAVRPVVGIGKDAVDAGDVYDIRFTLLLQEGKELLASVNHAHRLMPRSHSKSW